MEVGYSFESTLDDLLTSGLWKKDYQQFGNIL